MAQQPRSALYRIEAYGLANAWNLWALAEGDLTDLCRGCAGRGVIIRRPCPCAASTLLCPSCTRAEGCMHCRRKCPTCYGRGMAHEPVHAEDFLDRESLDIARRLFDVDAGFDFYRKRIDMHARPLE